MEGINSRLDGMQAAILTAKLPHLAEWTEKRILNAMLYDKWLANIPGIIIPKQRPHTKHTWHLYVIRSGQRKILAEYLADKGIETAVHYPVALPNMEIYKYLGYQPSDFPVATQLQDEILSLPMYPELTEEMIAYVADSIRSFFASLF